TRALDPRVKILYLIWVFLMMCVLMHPVILLAILLVTVGAVYAGRLSLWNLMKTARFGLFVAIASWVLWIVFLRSQGAVLISLGPLQVTEPGVMNGWSVAARIAGILFAFLVVFQTTANREVMTALYRLRVSVPFAMVIGIILRLIPQLRAEHATILEAQRSRAVEFNRGNLFARMRKHIAYIVPLILRALKITSDLSIAMEARGFDPYARRTFSEVLEIDARDVALIVLMAITLLAAVCARIAGFGGMPAQWVAK
ncbi:MAG: energy-coupling factor transporter transmembrane component T family protein, partial [Candidatus Dormibacteria bacterium]